MYTMADKSRDQIAFSLQIADENDYESAFDIANDAIRLAELFGDSRLLADCRANWSRIWARFIDWRFAQ